MKTINHPRAAFSGGTLYIPPEDARYLVGTVPRGKRTALPKYTLLNESPYTFTYKELLQQVAKSGNKTKSYSITRSELVKEWGWAIHENTSGKIALIGCETDEYKKLLKDPSVKKKPVSRRSKQTEGSELQRRDELFSPDEVLAPDPEEE